MKVLTILLLITYSSYSKGQDTLITYFDVNWKKTRSSDYEFYRKAYKNSDSQWIVEDYYRGNQIQMIGKYKKKNLKKEIGTFIYYYESGIKKMQITYDLGKRNGNYEKWYENGNIKVKGNYSNDKKNGDWIYYFDNENIDHKGQYIMENKEGIWIWNFESGKISAEIEFKNSIVVEEKYWNEDGTVASAEEAMCKSTFPGGERALLKYIATNTKYPEIAIEKGISGRVLIKFVVDKNGEITNVEVVVPIHPALDKEALRVVKEMPRWIPGKQYNRLVKVEYKIPINFWLN